MINVDIDKVFTPGVTRTGSCNDGYVAVSGQINATCNPNFQTVVSDTCREVLRNITVGKPTEQISTFREFESGLAVDGIRNTDIDALSCSHTDVSDDNPWWRVDLLKVYFIVTVRMLNRGMDRYGIDASDHLRNVSIRTGETVSNISTLCGFYAGPGTLGELVTIDCPPSTTGRYVEIALITEILTLCEVDVFVASV
ncbi:fucolectin-1-like [Saccostrea cucullata]|uniref:fucolectin-1-like n=1 Tax=Saccostrea cuccullata TaxID=36930 RepID=UPI002ED03312